MPDDKGKNIPKFEETTEVVNAPSFDDTVPIGTKKKEVSSSPLPSSVPLVSTPTESGSGTTGSDYSEMNYLGTPKPEVPQPIENQVPQISAATTQAATPVQNTKPEPTPVADKGFLNDVVQGLKLPAFNHGFNDLVVKPLAGATDFIDRSVDQIHRLITGESPPDWVKNGSMFDNIQKWYQKEYDEREKPESIAGEVVEGVVGTLPLMAALTTGQGELNILSKAPQAVSRLTKLFAIKGALNSYNDATKEGLGFTESAAKGSEGFMKGGIEGLTLEAQMLLGGALGNKAVKILADKGLFKDNKAVEGVLHALSVGTVFGGSSVASDVLDGQEINTREAAKQFGMGLAFEVPRVYRGLKTEIGKKEINDKAAGLASITQAADNMNNEGVIRTLLTLPTEKVTEINNGITDPHDVLYAKSIEEGAKAYEATDDAQKRNHYASQLILKAQGDVKYAADKISQNKEGFIDAISTSEDLTPEDKQGLIDRVNALSIKNPETVVQEQKLAEPEATVKPEGVTGTGKEEPSPQDNADEIAFLEEIKNSVWLSPEEEARLTELQGAVQKPITDERKTEGEGETETQNKSSVLTEAPAPEATSEQEPPVTGNETVVKTQEENGKGEKQPAGNRLFNEPLKAIKGIAKKYYERVFGKPKPEYHGSKKFDEARAKKIAKAYEDLKHNPDDPDTKKAYEALAKETLDQWKDLEDSGLKIEINDKEPYKNSQEMIDDVTKNNRVKILATESGFGENKITDQQRKDNPLLKDSGVKDANGNPLLVNDIFRAVHDIIGHGEIGNSFGPKGEENAWNVHARLYSPEARRAMTTETRGQNSYVNFSGINERIDGLVKEARDLRKEGKDEEAKKIVEKIQKEFSFADQKVGLLPEEFSNVDEKDIGDEDRIPEEEKKAESEQALKKLDDDIEILKQMSKKDIAEKKFVGMIERAYKAKKEGTITETQYDEFRDKAKEVLGGKAGSTIESTEAKLAVSAAMNKVKEKLLGQGYKNMALSTGLPITPRSVADLIDLTTNLINRGIDHGYTIADAVQKALTAIKKHPVYKKLLASKELDEKEFEKAVSEVKKEENVQQNVKENVKENVKKVTEPEEEKPKDYGGKKVTDEEAGISGEERERATTARIYDAKRFKDVAAEVDPNLDIYNSVSQEKAIRYIDKKLNEFHDDWLMTDLAEEIAKKGQADMFPKSVSLMVPVMVADRLNLMAEKESSPMQKNALDKLSAKVLDKWRENTTSIAQQLGLANFINSYMPKSKAGVKARVESELDAAQESYMKKGEKEALTSVTKELEKEIDKDFVERVKKAVKTEMERIAESLKGKEWVSKSNAALDDLLVDLKDC